MFITHIIFAYTRTFRPQNSNSPDKLCHPRTDAYSAQVLLNKQQIWCGRAYLDCYHKNGCIEILHQPRRCLKYSQPADVVLPRRATPAGWL